MGTVVIILGVEDIVCSIERVRAGFGQLRSRFKTTFGVWLSWCIDVDGRLVSFWRGMELLLNRAGFCLRFDVSNLKNGPELPNTCPKAICLFRWSWQPTKILQWSHLDCNRRYIHCNLLTYWYLDGGLLCAASCLFKFDGTRRKLQILQKAYVCLICN